VEEGIEGGEPKVPSWGVPEGYKGVYTLKITKIGVKN